MKFSEQQTAFINWAVKGSGSCVLEAVAGAGKTTTILEAATRMPGQVAIMAYNKKIADEIKGKLEERGITFRKVQAGTVHSFGMGAYRKAFPNAKVDADKVAGIVTDILGEGHAWATAVVDLVSLAKQSAFGVIGRIDDTAAWFAMADHHDVFSEIEENQGFNAEEIVSTAVYALNFSNRIVEVIDFDDMVYLPLLLRLRFWTFDVVMVDEAQDTNAARRALVRACLKKGGRAIAVGDSRQAIYGFCHPPGVEVLTPSGYVKVEEIQSGDLIVLGDTASNVAGWDGGFSVLQKHVFDYDNEMINIRAGCKSAKMTLHHRIPVKMDRTKRYFTYLMVRSGIFRVGYMAAYASAGTNKDKVERRFMLSHRCATERCDRAWLLAGFENEADARSAETALLKRIKGTTFSTMSDAEVSKLPDETEAALEILKEFGRRIEFPFVIASNRNDRKANHAFITEACNVMDGMLVSVFEDNGWNTARRGRSRQIPNWLPVSVDREWYTGKTYGITVPVLQTRDGYSQWPLYFAGGILVHNTGADSDALDLIAKDFNAIRLPLTVTYRCPKAVVAFAQQWVSHIQAHETAPDGAVLSVDADTFLRDYVQGGKLGAECAILCRNTRPLVSFAFGLIARGVGCRVEGREIGNGLKKLAGRWARAKTTAALETQLALYLARETTKLSAAGKEQKLQEVEDKVETLRVIIGWCEEVGKTKTTDVVERIDSLFADNVSDVLTLSTIHKAKGREWQTVFWLDREGTCPSRWARKAWQIEQEHNLCYVAATRAKATLIEIPPFAAVDKAEATKPPATTEPVA